MRLLHTGRLSLQSFDTQNLPQYVILSHTWGDDEVTFADLRSRELPRRGGSVKLASSCRQAKLDGYDWIWVDTCCIDKSSSAELSEAINSMYRWYQNAQVCYAYLADVDHTSKERSLEDQVKSSRWLRRGWTLQELIAPEIVEFYDVHWKDIGTKSSFKNLLHNVTGIDMRVLMGEPPAVCNVAHRISWASSRQTTRDEDMAYSLLGLLDVNMPLLYGEGMMAFKRLQEEVIKTSRDYTVLAWRTHEGLPVGDGVLAPSPKNFCRPAQCHSCSVESPWIYKDLLPRPYAVGSHVANVPYLQDHPFDLPVLVSGRLRLTMPVRTPAPDPSTPFKSLDGSTKDILAYIGYADGKSNNILCLQLGPDWEDGSDLCRRSLIQISARQLPGFSVATVNMVSWRSLQTEIRPTLKNSTQQIFRFKALPPCFKISSGGSAISTQLSETQPTSDSPIVLRRGQESFAMFLHKHNELSENVLVKFGPTSDMPTCDIALVEQPLVEVAMEHPSGLFVTRHPSDRAQILSTWKANLILAALRRRPMSEPLIPEFAIRLTCEKSPGNAKQPP